MESFIRCLFCLRRSRCSGRVNWFVVLVGAILVIRRGRPTRYSWRNCRSSTSRAPFTLKKRIILPHWCSSSGLVYFLCWHHAVRMNNLSSWTIPARSRSTVLKSVPPRIRLQAGLRKDRLCGFDHNSFAAAHAIRCFWRLWIGLLVRDSQIFLVLAHGT